MIYLKTCDSCALKRTCLVVKSVHKDRIENDLRRDADEISFDDWIDRRTELYRDAERIANGCDFWFEDISNSIKSWLTISFKILDGYWPR